MEWDIATQSHRGNVRRINEDALLADKHYPLLMIADGMGGHAAGEVASQMLAEQLAALHLAGSLPQALDQVRSAVERCNSDMIAYARTHLAGQTIGSTVVAMLAQECRGACVWAGDSRLYRARHRELEQLTGDHSHVAELVRAGRLSAEEAVNHPSSNAITRAVGAAPLLDLDLETFDIRLGDTYLLCSDGLYHEVSPDEIVTAMLAADIRQSARQLLNLCLGRRARDNISFIIGRPVGPGDDPDATLTYYPDSAVESP
ncbi:MAG: serine/threonine-protein phosphatase [Halioglobus sp.]|nr:serine/threonine-protein phosphatase [Halioglobus sp.]